MVGIQCDYQQILVCDLFLRTIGYIVNKKKPFGWKLPSVQDTEDALEEEHFFEDVKSNSCFVAVTATIDGNSPIWKLQLYHQIHNKLTNCQDIDESKWSNRELENTTS